MSIPEGDVVDDLGIELDVYNGDIIDNNLNEDIDLDIEESNGNDDDMIIYEPIEDSSIKEDTNSSTNAKTTTIETTHNDNTQPTIRRLKRKLKQNNDFIRDYDQIYGEPQLKKSKQQTYGQSHYQRKYGYANIKSKYKNHIHLCKKS